MVNKEECMPTGAIVLIVWRGGVNYDDPLSDLKEYNASTIGMLMGKFDGMIRVAQNWNSTEKHMKDIPSDLVRGWMIVEDAPETV